MKYLKNFKKIIRLCMAHGWITKDPFLGYKAKIKAVERHFLSKEEIQMIYEKKFASDRLNQVRDIFLFSCYTGLAYVDVKQLSKSNINIGIDGDHWIFTHRQKTDTSTRVPLLPVARELVLKYENHPQCVNSDVLFPVLSNQKMNSYLKEIASVCGINKDFTFHIARHTFATTVTLSNGVPIESVSKMLGHTNIKTTQHYAKILDKKVSDDMAVLKGKL
ncbi:tyrosine-type recombinase/integrase [Chryseobacterium sp. S-02]|uniref:site-specific integrase n=1 Tax=Chryseobacterium sp. S-02 TaxID=3404064 RepID=UPI003CF85810